MRLLLLIAVSCLACVSSSPIDHRRKLINRPTNDVIFRNTRSAQVKGHNVVYVKGGGAPRNPELNLRKGEYMCGNKVCSLQPGQLPKGCEDHICQYPLPNTDLQKQLLATQPRRMLS